MLITLAASILATLQVDSALLLLEELFLGQVVVKV
jgi:hypothetical protein